MEGLYYIGLDVHKKSISYAIKTQAGEVIAEGKVAATREALNTWAAAIEHPWVGALEATMFSGWIYDHLAPQAIELQVAHPAMLKAIACGKKKNDRLDASKICDLLRCDLLPRSYMAPPEIRELRRVLRYRNLLVGEAVRMKNKISGLLMEVGEPYDARRLHGRKYFHSYLDNLRDTPDSVLELLAITRGSVEMFDRLQNELLRKLEAHALLRERVALLQSIRGVGQVTALSWALEIAEPGRFGSIGRVVSYCGLCSAQRQSAGKTQRGPLSKQRNKHLQRVLIEAAKLAPRWNPELREVYERELDRGPRNRATLAVARKLVAYLWAVDRTRRPFVPRHRAEAA
jgi:transposase